MTASPMPAPADHLFERYRAAVEKRDLLRREAETLRASADRLAAAGVASQASLVRGRVEHMEQAAAAADQAVKDVAGDQAAALSKRLRSARRRALTEAQADAAKAKPFRALEAGLTFDRRTAGGSRELRLGNAKGKSEARVTLATYSALIKDPKERTDARLRAMEAFDDLWHRAEAGLYPEPRFEPAVDTSAGTSGVTAHRMDGLAEMQRLTAYIGRQAQALLKMRIVERMEIQAIARIADRDPEDIGALIHAAIDGVAGFYGFSLPPLEVERLDAELAQS